MPDTLASVGFYRTALEDSERLFRSAFEGAAAGMTLTDPSGMVEWVNASFAEMLGYEPSELVGTRMAELVQPDDLPGVVEAIGRVRAGVVPRCVFEKRYLRKDGGIVLGRAGISTVCADDGTILHFVAQVEDVTELRRVQADLDESQTLHRLVFESSRDVLSVFGTDGVIRLVSPSVGRILGYDPAEVVGLNYAGFIHPDDLTVTARAVKAAIGGEQPSLFRSRFLASDGTYRLWEGTVSPGIGSDGEVSFLVANSRDVTSQVELEDQLRHAQKMEAVGRLAGGVAHDFNNLLLAIRGYAELALVKVEARDDSSGEIAEILVAAERASSLTAQLLAFSRRQVMNIEILDLGHVVSQMASMLRRMISGSVELSTVLPEEPALVCADRAQIEQVIANLSVNARDAMPDGGHLAIEVAVAPDEGRVLLIVRDDGSGMDAATGAQIFEPFFTTKGAEGTGLGLSMVHGIVKQSGGEIAVDSEPGEGTTFTIGFPLADGEPLPEPVAAAAATGGAETILLVEDDAVVMTVVTSMLEQRGYGLLAAGSGEEAVAMAAAAPDTVDLLITDLVLPGLNGRATSEAVLEHQPLARVLYMSGYTDDVVIRVGRFAPGTSFIQKPFTGDELARRVRKLLDERAA
jgi:two-component system, cell cycle sensor histidine kinase and response regulator CckA